MLILRLSQQVFVLFVGYSSTEIPKACTASLAIPLVCKADKDYYRLQAILLPGAVEVSAGVRPYTTVVVFAAHTLFGAWTVDASFLRVAH